MLLSDAIEHYIGNRRAQGVKPSTLTSDAGALRALLAVSGNLHVSNISVRHLDAFWSRHADWRPATANRVRAQLSTFFKWAQQRGYLPMSADPMAGSRRRRVPLSNHHIVPPSRFGELMDAAPLPRDRALLALGLYGFLRVSETTALRWSDLDFDNHRIAVYRKKVEQADRIPMSLELKDELQRWRLAYGSEAGCLPKPGWYVCPPYDSPVFSGHDRSGHWTRLPRQIRPNRPMSRPATPIKAALEALGIDAPYEGGHTLRRSGATALYNRLSALGHDRAIRLCQAMLGHSDIARTEIYLQLDLDRKVRDDLIAGVMMFPTTEGTVVNLEARREADGGEAAV